MSTQKAPPFASLNVLQNPIQYCNTEGIQSIIDQLICTITDNMRIITESNNGLNILIYFSIVDMRLIFMKVKQSILPKEVFKIINCLCLQIHTSAKQTPQTRTPQWFLPCSLIPALSRPRLVRDTVPRKLASQKEHSTAVNSLKQTEKKMYAGFLSQMT